MNSKNMKSERDRFAYATNKAYTVNVIQYRVVTDMVGPIILTPMMTAANLNPNPSVVVDGDYHRKGESKRKREESEQTT